MANPTPITQATVPGILKEFYDQQKVEMLNFTDNPTFALLHKETSFPGKYFPQPVAYGLTQGASSTFANAYANQTSPQVAEFLVTRVSDFSLATLDGQLLAAASSEPGAFIDAAEFAIDSAWQTCVNRLSSALFRNGAGTVGQIASCVNISGNNYTVTLVVHDDSVQFEANQVILAVQNVDGSGTAPVDVGTITSVNRNAGTMIVNCSTNIATNWPANYYLAVQGDLPNATNNNFPTTGATTNSLLRLAGFAAWMPIAGPAASGDLFFGVNRYLDPTRLAGVTFDGSSMSLQEALLQGTGRIAQQGGRVTTAICSYATYTAIVVSLGTQVVYIDQKLGQIGFRGIQVNGANSVMNVFPDRSCPDGLVYALSLEDWCLRSAGEMPHILQYLDNIEILRNPTTDDCTVRIGWYGNMYCKKPGRSGVIKVQLQSF